MEEEYFLSGYCKALDSSRIVTVEVENSDFQADCAFPDCPYAPNCEIAKKILCLS